MRLTRPHSFFLSSRNRDHRRREGPFPRSVFFERCQRKALVTAARSCCFAFNHRGVVQNLVSFARKSDHGGRNSSPAGLRDISS